MTITDDQRKRFGQLADNLMCACLSHMAGVTYNTIKKNHGSAATGRPPGDYWIALAMRTTQEWLEVRNLEIERQEKESGASRIRRRSASPA